MLMHAAFLLLAVGEATANPPYLCDLTQSEVEDLLDDYGISRSFSEVEPFILHPFDCGTYGDLCPMVGYERATDFVCQRWEDMRDGATPSVIVANADTELDSMVDAWFDERFPDGIGDSHPWWGASPTALSCDKKAFSETYTTSTGVQFRARVRAFYVMTLVYNRVGGNTQAMFRYSYILPWFRNTVADVEVDNTYSSPSAGGGTCSASTPDAIDDDGFVSVGVDGFFHYPWEDVSNVGTADNGASYEMSATACRQAPWNDPDC